MIFSNHRVLTVVITIKQTRQLWRWTKYRQAYKYSNNSKDTTTYLKIYRL